MFLLFKPDLAFADYGRIHYNPTLRLAGTTCAILRRICLGRGKKVLRIAC
jgi:hypothetical protein